MWSLSIPLSDLNTIGQVQIPPVVKVIVSPDAAATGRRVVCQSRIVAAYGGWLSTGISAATISILSPVPQSPVSTQVSLVHSAHPLCQESTLPGFLLWLLIWSLYTQQSGLSTTRPRQRPSWDGGYCFPSDYCYLEGSGLPAHDAICGRSELQDPGVYSLRCLPKVSVPSLSSGVTSPVCPRFCQSPWKVAANEKFCVGPLNSSWVSSLCLCNSAAFSCLLSVYFWGSGALSWES